MRALIEFLIEILIIGLILYLLEPVVSERIYPWLARSLRIPNRALKFLERRERGQGTFLFQRLFDIIISFLNLVFLAPIMLTISMLIKIDSRGPVHTVDYTMHQW